MTPGDLNKIFFTNGGAESVESAIKLARNYHRKRGNGQKTKMIAREVAYHGTTLGALSCTGITDLRSQFEPFAPGGCHVPNTNLYRYPDDRDPLLLADGFEKRILFEGPETVAAVILEPVQNAGGCFVPPDGYFQRVREICDKYDVLLISDEVICAWGRLGHYFACDRFGYQPDIITTAKALTSAYVPMGAMIASDKLAEPFYEDHESFAHGFTFAGHPIAAAVALANIEVYEKEDLCGHVLAKEGEFRDMLESLRDIPIVGDVRGAGFFQAIELVKDQDTKESFEGEQAEELLRGFLSGELYKNGLICRADDRGDPVIQLAPPLICDTEQFEEMHDILRPVLEEASKRMRSTIRIEPSGTPATNRTLREAEQMKVGVPKEIKQDEYRVAITPAGVRELTEHGHEVFIEATAGEGSAITDAAFEAQGARIVPDAAAVFEAGEMILHVKELQASEIEMLKPEHLLFTYLHLAPGPRPDQGPPGIGCHLRRLRDGRRFGRPPAAARPDERDRRQDRDPGRSLHAGEAARRARHPARRSARAWPRRPWS